MGWFSSDRAVREYARDIWGVKPLRIVPEDKEWRLDRPRIASKRRRR